MEDQVVKQHWVSYIDSGAVVAECGLRKRLRGDAETLKEMETEKESEAR